MDYNSYTEAKKNASSGSDEDISLKKLKDWPLENLVSSLYLDGNNMLFVDSFIRKLRLSRKKNEAEDILAKLIRAFSKEKSIAKTILVYDYCEKKKPLNDENDLGIFEVLSASPEFNSSDDALVEWANKINPSEKNKSIFVTSDRGLQKRLEQTGIKKIMGTGVFFKIMKEFLGIEKYNSLLKK